MLQNQRSLTSRWRFARDRLNLLPVHFAAFFLLIALPSASALFAADAALPVAAEPPQRWWKGNLHTHSLWSDGDEYPEMVVRWYQQHGYNFLALSDHNILLEGRKWIDVLVNRGGVAAYYQYVAAFGANWVQVRDYRGRTQVRLRPLNEFRGLFEERGRFLLIPSEEITDEAGRIPLHMNATNLRRLIRPQGGSTVLEVMQNDANAVLQQRAETGQPMFPHLNHPNYRWAVKPEELMQVRGEGFFEVYNGQPDARNPGDATHPSTDQMWDLMLAWRLTELKLRPLYALAVDDAHHYHTNSATKANPGRGWVMVQAPELSAAAIVRAMEEGNFYASTGVVLEKVWADEANRKLRVEIKTEPGIEYTTQFLGSRKRGAGGLEPASERPALNSKVPPGLKSVGEVLATVKGPIAEYQCQGDELYIRAKVISSKLKTNGAVKGELETAWTQPRIPREN